MTDLEPILSLWRESEAAGADYVLATVVAVEGSSYRRPGARMLLAADGRRVGTVSGGCLEAEVASRAWWLTAHGPVVELYSTTDDDGDRPYGSGCGGMVSILLERRATADALLRALETAFNERAAIAVATVLEGPRIGCRAFAGLTNEAQETIPALNAPSLRTVEERVDGLESGSMHQELEDLANLALARGASMDYRICVGDAEVRAWADYRAARPGLWIFGAGDDAKPLACMARALGWFAAVADGRAHLATRERFGAVNVVRVLAIAELPGPEMERLDLRATDAAVVMTHSYEQDSRILAALLGRDVPLAYLGVLGPQRRTRELLAEAARLLNLPGPAERIERWLVRMHAPTGLDLGAEAPAAIALSILAEIQQTLTEATALPLREVRAAKVAVELP